MPVYNGGSYLAAAIESMLGQSYADFELLIIDDASTDCSAAVAMSFADQRIRLLANPANLGLIATLNVGLAAARGDYVARMDQDDISMPSRLERQVEFLDRSPDIGVLGTGFRLIDSAGAAGTVVLLPANPALIQWSIALFSPLAHPTVMMRRELVLSLGGYRAEAVHCEDYDLWWRASQATKLANLQEVLLHLRKHDSNYTAQFASAHNKNGCHVCAEMLARSLATAVPVDLVAAIWGRTPADETQLGPGVELMLRHYRKCLSDHPLSRPERKALQRAFADWLYEFTIGPEAAIHGGLRRMLAKVLTYLRLAGRQRLSVDERMLVYRDGLRRAGKAVMEMLRSRWVLE